MQIVFAGFMAFGGIVTLIAGVYSLRRTRAVIAGGEGAFALVKHPPSGADRPLLQFETADGRVMELFSPVVLPVGSSVFLRYDPDDPRDVVLPDHRRTRLDQGFVLGGSLVLVTAMVLVATAF